MCFSIFIIISGIEEKGALPVGQNEQVVCVCVCLCVCLGICFYMLPFLTQNWVNLWVLAEEMLPNKQPDLLL